MFEIYGKNRQEKLPSLSYSQVRNRRTAQQIPNEKTLNIVANLFLRTNVTASQELSNCFFARLICKIFPAGGLRTPQTPSYFFGPSNLMFHGDNSYFSFISYSVALE